MKKGTPKKTSPPARQAAPSILQSKAISSVPIYIQSPSDLILLLKTPEPKCVVQCIDLLYDMMLKNPKTGEELIEQGVLEDVFSLPPVGHPIFNATRFRFLSKMYVTFPAAGKRYSNQEELLRMAINDAFLTNDVPLRAFTLEYVSLMTENRSDVLMDVADNYDLDRIFVFANDHDVDVQNNSLTFLINLLNQPEILQKIVARRDITFKPFFTQVGCPYPDIQNKALDILLILMSIVGEHSNWIQEEFSNSGGVDLMFTILFIFHWRDLHPKCLKILSTLCQSTLHILNMDSVNGLQKLVKYITFIEDDELQAFDLDVIINASKFPEGRLVLTRSGVTQVLIDLLSSASEETKTKVMEAFHLLAFPPVDITEITKIDPVAILLGFLKDLDNSTTLRISTARTLSTLVKEIPVCALTLSKVKNFQVLQSILLKTPLVETKFLSHILNIMSTLLSNPVHLNKLINVNLITRLIFFLQLENKMLIISTLPILAAALSRVKGQKIFMCLGGINLIMKILIKAVDSDQLKAVCRFLKVAFQNETVTQNFLVAGLSSWFILNQKKFSREECFLEAFEALFDCDLSLKFEMNGRLELWDITRDGFYVWRTPRVKGEDLRLSIINQISLEMSNARPVYYLKLGIEASKPLDKEDSVSLLDLDESKEVFDTILFKQGIRSNVSLNIISNESLDQDERLLEIYDILRNILLKCHKVTAWKGSGGLHREWIEEVALLIGKTVDKAMSGEKSSEKCTIHTFELHLVEVMAKFGSSKIPIGALEVGTKFERAILFKVLADRIGLPCALIRGDFCTGWVEVAVPENNEDYKVLSLRQLTSNFIVDLVDEPGKLIPLESGLAYEYCSKPKFTSKLGSQFAKDKNLLIPNEVCRTKQQFHIEKE